MLPANYIVQVKFKATTKSDLDFSNVESILKKYDAKLERAFDESEESLTSEVEESKSRGIDLPDLSRYYVVYTDNKEKAE